MKCLRVSSEGQLRVATGFQWRAVKGVATTEHHLIIHRAEHHPIEQSVLEDDEENDGWDRYNDRQ